MSRKQQQVRKQEQRRRNKRRYMRRKDEKVKGLEKKWWIDGKGRRRVKKSIPKNYSGYRKMEEKIAWKKLDCFPPVKTSNSDGKDVTLTCWRHPVHKSKHWLEYEPQKYPVYVFKSVAEKANIKKLLEIYESNKLKRLRRSASTTED